MNNPEYWKNDSSYFASPKGSERALAFQEALDQAGGSPFTFRGLPYAGEQPSAPVGLPPNQQIQQFIPPPSGGWTDGVDPNNFINAPEPVTSRAGDMSGPTWQQADDWNAQNYFREYPINPLTGQPEYLTGDIWSQSVPTDGRDQVIDMYGNVTSPNYTGTSLPFDDPSIAGTSISHPKEKYLDMYANAQLPDMGIGDGGTSGYSLPRGSVGPGQQQAMFSQMYHPDAQGLLSGTIDTLKDKEGISNPKAGATDVFGYSQFGNHPSIPRNTASVGASNTGQPQIGGLLADNPGGTTDKTGWDRDDIFARAMLNLSNNILAPNSFY